MDYSKSKLYEIYSNKGDKIYLGATTLPLTKRLKKHINKYKSEYEICCSVKELFDEYGYENCKIRLIENFPC